MKKYIVNSLDEYIKVITEISHYESDTWFRGQINATWKLSPSLFRQRIETDFVADSDDHFEEQTHEIIYKLPDFNYALGEFKRKAIGLIDNTPNNDFEWMFLMQHYGIPTSLLDWSTNALVGLYFAIPESVFFDEDAFDPDIAREEALEFLSTGYTRGGSSIYVINPLKINHEAHNIDEIPDIHHNYAVFEPFLIPRDPSISTIPLCIQVPYIDKRIRSQSGTFTLHSAPDKDKGWTKRIDTEIYKIFIPKHRWAAFKNDMKMLGITTSYIFPDLQGVAKEIKEDILRFAQKEIRKKQ